MTIEEINALQEKHGLKQMQSLIESGDVWKMEGSMGRAAMNHLESGACYLPDKPTWDYYGNKLPARSWLDAGTKGTLENSENFWQQVEDGEILMSREEDED